MIGSHFLRSGVAAAAGQPVLLLELPATDWQTAGLQQEHAALPGKVHLTPYRKMFTKNE